MLISRISRRVLAEHHLALSKTLGHNSLNSQDPHVGIIYTGLDVKRSVDKCVRLLRNRPPKIEDDDGEIVHCKEWAEVVVEGQLDTRFAYIREHLEYILFELLKNALRATALKHRHATTFPPIYATIVAGEDDVNLRISDQGGGLSSNNIQSPSDLFSFSHARNATRMHDSRIGALRSASSRGVKATVAEQVGGWEVAEPEDDQDAEDPERGAGIAPHQRMGLGLPMSNIFATWVLDCHMITFISGSPAIILDTLAARWSWSHWMGGAPMPTYGYRDCQENRGQGTPEDKSAIGKIDGTTDKA
ncbi:hypothetical protein ID866_3448 [Astraeus odoratus]|nr:hypothetical protein ID866_3448 [Astraeus odoratus]